ncbi:hypothetical protein DC498_02620 [Terrimonas sp.]|uniref:hypothetical protein n=1 Tax=Terrimonas sp. TaxID=1914338 RepID=UPI000D5169C8|nr:hypothetical protein [Terrimonas sp.]PVD54289.1 hypothetical protein DC498_02620 [Terrimonas sp.]
MTSTRKYILPFTILLLISTLPFCKKQTDSYTPVSSSTYYPAAVGKYIQYRLDSVVFTNFDRDREVHSYQVKDSIDAAITDNLGRPGFRIRRMIRDLDGTTPWQDNATFMATVLPNSVEYVENNLRFIKLVTPVKNDYYWEGNSYIFTGTTENSSSTSESPYDFYFKWNYIYQNAEQPFVVNGTTVENTVTVLQQDQSTGNPVAYPASYADSTYSVEVYGKDIGLIYKDFIHWVYVVDLTLMNCRMVIPGEPVNTPCPVGLNCDSLAATKNGYAICDTITPYSYNGYGIKLTMMEHN